LIYRLFESAYEKEIRETEELVSRVNLSINQLFEFDNDWTSALCARIIPQHIPSSERGFIESEIKEIIASEGSYNLVDTNINFRSMPSSKRMDYRSYLRRKERVLAKGKAAFDIFETFLTWFVRELYQNADVDETSDLWIPLSSLHLGFDDFLDRLVGNLGSNECLEFELFYSEWQRLIPLVFEKDKPRLPSQNSKYDNANLIDSYFKGSPFHALLSTVITYRIPSASRSEHTHVLGGSGHGKTELLKLLITDDMMQALDDQRSILVIDSQGDMIKSLLSLPFFEPDDGPLADRLIIIDPNDIQVPPALNLFALATEASDLLIREKKIQSATALYEYLFGELLGAEMTQRQGTLFSYLARLMVEIPRATIHTLKDVLEHGDKYKVYMNRLSGSAKDFFQTRFFDPSYRPVKTQVINRLWGILSTGTLDRMFSSSEMRIDFAEAFQSGKIIFVNTAKELLKSEASSFFGRFILSLVSHSIIERAGIKEYDRVPVSIYIDEAHEYLDTVMAELFSQSRKYGVSLTIAHQNLDQLDNQLRSAIAASTSVKIAGGLSDKDARAMAGDMKCSPQFISQRVKSDKDTEFAIFIRNELSAAATLYVPLGLTRQRQVLSEDNISLLYARNRELYGRRDKEEPAVASAPPARSPEPQATGAVERRPIRPSITPEGKGGIQSAGSGGQAIHQGKGGSHHRYLQALVKKLGEDAGYKALIEAATGNGFADVSLTRNNENILIEICVSTDANYELGNIQKCLSEHPTKLLIVSSNTKHLAKIKSLSVQAGISSSILHFISQDELIDHIRPLERQEAALEPLVKIVKGYKVKVKHIEDEEINLLDRKRRIADILARNMNS
jgi:hypothetical protein